MQKIRLKKQSKKFDRTLFILVFILCVLGLVAVADASAPIALHSFGDKFYFVKQQAVWGLIGITLLIIFSKIKYTFWEKAAKPLFFITIVLMMVRNISDECSEKRRRIFFPQTKRCIWKSL